MLVNGVGVGDARGAAMSKVTPFDVWERGGWCSQEVAGEQYYVKGWRSLLPRTLPTQGVELTDHALLVRSRPTGTTGTLSAWRFVIARSAIFPPRTPKRYRPVLDHLPRAASPRGSRRRIWASPEIEFQYDRRGEVRESDTGRVRCRISLALPEPHLLIPMNAPPFEPHTMLPMGGSVTVKTDGVPMSVFEPVLNDAGEAWAYATLQEIHEQLARSTRELIEVRINGLRAGQMTPAMSKKFLPVVRTLAGQGRLCATPAIVRGNRLQVEVRVYGAQAAACPRNGCWSTPTTH